MNLTLKDAIKKNVKSHTLTEVTVAYILKKLGYANYNIYGLISMHKTYEKLCREYKDTVESIEIENYNVEDMSNTIWFCWLQGIENAPDLVQNCLNSIKYNCSNKNIIIIDKTNYQKYTSLPNYIIEKWEKEIISNTLFSDLIRINILLRHGGLWLDSTTYLTAPLPKYIFSNDLFVYRNGQFNMDDINIANWLIYAKPNNFLLAKTQALLFKYWQDYNYIRQYFIFHIFFRMVSDSYPDEYNKIPYYNHLDNHIFAQELLENYNQERFEQICNITSIHKLSNKLDLSKYNENSYYAKLNELYKQQGIKNGK